MQSALLCRAVPFHATVILCHILRVCVARFHLVTENHVSLQSYSDTYGVTDVNTLAEASTHWGLLDLALFQSHSPVNTDHRI